MDQIGSFLETAKKHGRDVSKLWKALESEPQKLAERAWAMPLDHVGTFLETAKKHGRDVSTLWEALENEPQRLVEHARATPLDHVGSFLEIARRHTRNVNKLWEAIESEPEELAKRFLTTSLEHLGSFFETAKDHGRDVDPLWVIVENDPKKIVERAWATPLVHVGSFLEVAKRHERNVSWLWEAFEDDPQKIIERAWATPLVHVGYFLEVAKHHDRDIRWLCDALEKDPLRLAQKAKISQVDYLSAFCKRAPDSTVRVLLEGIQPDHWNSALEGGHFHGSMGLASRCEEVGRNDLKSALVSIALRRANWKDFPAGSVHSVVWLLSNISKEDMVFRPIFIDEICTNKWLRWQYSTSVCRQLAAGLRLLAISQDHETRQRFYNIGLKARLETEFTRFSSLLPYEQYEVIQLLGCVTLLDWQIKGSVLHRVPVNQVCALHVDILPHRTDAEKVGVGQFNFWLGLRALASMTNKPLPMPAPIMEQTLGLWKKNLDESSAAPHSVEHTINSKMVSWLGDCLRKKKGLLPASLVKVNP